MNRLLLPAALAASLAAAALGACGATAVVCNYPTDTACGNDICANLASDPNHCGDCNKVCATGQSCITPDGGTASSASCRCPDGTLAPDGGVCSFAK